MDEGSRGFGIRMATPALNYYDYETPVLSGKWGEEGRGIGFGGRDVTTLATIRLIRGFRVSRKLWPTRNDVSSCGCTGVRAVT